MDAQQKREAIARRLAAASDPREISLLENELSKFEELEELDARYNAAWARVEAAQTEEEQDAAVAAAADIFAEAYELVNGIV